MTLQLLPFIAACVLLAIIPGPGMLYVLARTASGGRGAGLQSAAGTAVGGSVHVLAAALGISAILAASAQAYGALRWAGALYLMYLGIKTLLEKDSPSSMSDNRPRHSFWQGILTEVLNPKTAIFFLAFIPAFVPAGPTLPTVAWFLVLGFISVALNTAADVIVVVTATRIAQSTFAMPAFGRWRRSLSGVTLLGMGLLTATHDSRR